MHQISDPSQIAGSQVTLDYFLLVPLLLNPRVILPGRDVIVEHEYLLDWSGFTGFHLQKLERYHHEPGMWAVVRVIIYVYLVST